MPHGRNSQHRHPHRRRHLGRKRRSRPSAGPDGLWEGHRVEDVATPEAFARDPGAGPALLRRAARAAEARSSPTPRTGRWRGSMREWPGELLIVTQNVDDLHERAGAKRRAAHAWRAQIGLVPRLRRPRRAGRRRCRDGPACPACGHAGAAPRHRLVRRDALRDGADRTGACARPTCSSRSAPRARSIPPPASSRPRAISARARWR